MSPFLLVYYELFMLWVFTLSCVYKLKNWKFFLIILLNIWRKTFFFVSFFWTFEENPSFVFVLSCQDGAIFMYLHEDWYYISLILLLQNTWLYLDIICRYIARKWGPWQATESSTKCCPQTKGSTDQTILNTKRNMTFCLYFTYIYFGN